jgi:tetratricopeptide (TPR) repeat protein
LDAASARRYAEVVAPFRVLGRRLAPAGVHHYCKNLALFADNRLAEAREAFLELVERLKDDKHYYRSLPAESRKLFTGGAVALLGLLESFRDTGETLRRAEELDHLGSKFYDMIGLRLRIAHHAYRGEIELSEPYRERLDLHAMQYGSAWQVDLWAPAAMMTAYSNLGDVMGVKQVADRLASLAGELPHVRLAELAEGTHALLRGDTERAIELLEALREGGQLRGYPGCASSWGTLATAYNHAGQYEKAKALCESQLAELGEPALEFVVFTLKLQLQLCLADAALGNSERAAGMLDRLIEKYADRGPVTVARLHQTRARVALLAGDQHAFEVHLAAMGEAARATGNPSLLLQYKRLARKVPRPGGTTGHAPVVLGQTVGASTAGPSTQSSEAATVIDTLGQSAFDAQTLVEAPASQRSEQGRGAQKTKDEAPPPSG